MAQPDAAAAPKPPQESKAVYPSVTVSEKCPECPKCEECDKKKKKKDKPKGRPPILEVVSGVVLFIVLILSTTKKLEKEKGVSEQREYINVVDKEPLQKEPAPIRSEKLDLSHFSELERQYIEESCKGKKGSVKERCIQKSINELLDLY